MAPSKFKPPLVSSLSGSSGSTSSQESVSQGESSAKNSELSKERRSFSNKSSANALEIKDDVANNVNEALENYNDDKENDSPRDPNASSLRGAGLSKPVKRPASEEASTSKVTKRKKETQKTPCVSYTDAEYERIFRAALSFPGTSSSALNATPDLFDFSQSDLEDLNEADEEQSTNANNPLNGKESCSKEIFGNIKSEPGESPVVEYLCHASQPSCTGGHQDMPPTESIQLKDDPGSSQTSQANSNTFEEDSSSIVSSTPVSNEASNLPKTCGRPSAPKNLIALDKIVSHSSKATRPISTDNTARPVSRGPTPSPITPKPVSRGPTPSPITPRPVSRGPTPSPITPRPVSRGPTPSPITPRPVSRGPTPSPVTPRPVSRESNPNHVTESPAVTPSQGDATSVSGSQREGALPGSQQLTQEFHQSQPSSQMTAKERLEWLRLKRVSDGIWVQCEHVSCGKWRYLADCSDPCSLPDKWFCNINPDKEYNSCDVPEKRLSLRAEEDMIFNKFSPGSVVWARLDGFPWWPAMVEDDPDLELFYWIDELSDIPTWYHVSFFDDSHITRAWIQTEKLKKFLPDSHMGGQDSAYSERISVGCKAASDALKLNVLDRLNKYSFASCYKGPIGGRSSRKYRGCVGNREQI